MYIYIYMANSIGYLSHSINYIGHILGRNYDEGVDPEPGFKSSGADVYNR